MKQTHFLSTFLLLTFSVTLSAYPWAKFKINASHNVVDHEETSDRLIVKLWQGTFELKSSTSVPSFTNGQCTFSYPMNADFITHITVETTGTDGFFINTAKLEKLTKPFHSKTEKTETIQNWEDWGGRGFCLSKDNTDASRQWLGYTKGCHRGLKFDVESGEITPLYGWDEAMRGLHSGIIKIKTKDAAKAGTNSNIFLGIHGSKGNTHSGVWLNRMKGGNIFEAGDTDEFRFDYLPDLGTLSKVTLWSDGKHMASNWLLEQVEVTYKGTKKTGAYDDWVDSGETANVTLGRTYNYTVKVSTTNTKGAGSNANMSLTIYGDKGSIGPLTMNPYISGNAFESGATNTFSFKKSVDVGNIQKIKLYSDGKGISPDWHCNVVKIAKSGTAEKHFSINEWINPRETVNRSAGQPTKNYQVTVITGNTRGGGTNSNIYLTIYGTKGNTGAKKLNHLISGNAFERGDTDKLTLRNLKDVGTVNKVKIYSDGYGAGADWSCYMVKVQKSGSYERSFKFGEWINPKETAYRSR